MTQQQKQKKIYAINEVVFVHPIKKRGVVKEIQTKKSQGIFQALIEFKDGNETVQQVFHLKEIDKLREKKQPILEVDKDTVLFAKVRPDATIPSKHEEDGCYDIYACFDGNTLILNPHEIVEVPTGIASCFSSKYRFDLSRERGSTGSIGMEVRCGQIDSGYRGEWFVKLTNVTNNIIKITKEIDKVDVLGNVIYYPYTKAICQAALEIVPNVKVQEITYDELKQIPSERGMGKLGSSKK